jgi:hypothetical protein
MATVDEAAGFLIFWILIAGAVILYVVGTLKPGALVAEEHAASVEKTSDEKRDAAAYAAGLREDRVIWYGDFRKDFTFFWYQQMPQAALLLGARHRLDPEPMSVKAALTVQQVMLSNASAKWIDVHVDSATLGTGYLLVVFFVGLFLTPVVHALHGIVRHDYGPYLGYAPRDTVFGGYSVGVGLSFGVVGVLTFVTVAALQSSSSVTTSTVVTLLVFVFNQISSNVAIVFEYAYRYNQQVDGFGDQKAHAAMYPTPGAPSVAYLDENAPRPCTFAGCCCCPDGLGAAPADEAGQYGSLT